MNSQVNFIGLEDILNALETRIMWGNVFSVSRFWRKCICTCWY